MRSLLQDARVATRRLIKAPGFTAVVLLTLGLCVGANAAIFSVVNAVILRPLPFPEPDRVVRVRPEQTMTARMIEGIGAAAESYVALAGAAPTSLTLTGTDQPELVAASVVGAEHLAVFRVQPMIGRGFLHDDSEPGAEPVVQLGYGLWQRAFGGDSSVIGRRVALAGEGSATRTVIGVMPPAYRPFPWRSEAFVPMVLARGTHDYSDMARFVLFGRLRPEATVPHASTEIKIVLERLATTAERGYVSAEEARAATVIREHGWRVASIERSLWLLLGSVSAVLLIGCVNVANLLLARAAAREGELAVRRALGGAPTHIVRLLLTESALLGVGGGALGLVAATAGLSTLRRLLPTNLPTVSPIVVDITVFGFALLVSLIGTLLFGLLPALRSSRAAEAAIRQSSRSTVGREKLRLNRALVAVEVAICVALVAAASLFVKSLTVLRDVDPGFEPGGLATMRVTFSPARYPNESSRQGALAEIERRIEALPGVQSTGSIQVLPLTPGTMGVGISPDGNPLAADERPLLVSYRIVTTGYAAAVGIPLLEGRYLEAGDRVGAPPAGLVNLAMAKTLWPGARSVVGREVRWGTGELWFTVVGVVDDVHQHSLAQVASAEAYVPYAQDGGATSMNVMIRGGGPELLSAGRDAVWAIDPNIPVTGLRSMTDVVEGSLATPRFHATLFGLFAVLATVLAAVGIYGVTSHLVSLRTREIGIRLAFGAPNRRVLWWVASLGIAPVATGLAAGLAIAVIGTRLMVGMLYGVRPTDPMVLAAVLMALALVAVLALAVPALRALGIDPVTSLKGE